MIGKFLLAILAVFIFSGCSQKELIVKKEYIEIQTCKIVIPEFLTIQTEVNIPKLKDNSPEEMLKVKKYIQDLLNERETDRIKFLKIKELYEQFLNCSLNSFK